MLTTNILNWNIKTVTSVPPPLDYNLSHSSRSPSQSHANLPSAVGLDDQSMSQLWPMGLQLDHKSCSEWPPVIGHSTTAAHWTHYGLTSLILSALDLWRGHRDADLPNVIHMGMPSVTLSKGMYQSSDVAVIFLESESQILSGITPSNPK